MADLQKVQEAADLAHKNFLRAIDVSENIPQRILTDYLQRFLDAPAKRPAEIRRFAERSIHRLLAFNGEFTDIIFKINFVLLERNVLVGGATTTSMGLLLKGFSSHLDNVVRKITRHNENADIPQEFLAEDIIEKLKTDAENLGYSAAIAEQLGANLIEDRVNSLNAFAKEYLSYKTPTQVIKNINSQDVTDILFEFLLATVEDLALLGPIKRIFEVWDRKRRPKAGVRPGDTDIMVELYETLEQDAQAIEHISTALADVKTYAEALRIRDAEAQKSLGLSTP